LRSDTLSITVTLAPAQIDFFRLEAARDSADAAALAAAAALYRDEFLADLAIESDPFEHWLGEQRARTAALVCRVLHRLSGAAGAAGDHARAIDAARRLVRLDPLDEEAHATLMRAFFAAGQRAAALKQFDECTEILRRELDVAPHADIRGL